MKRKPKCWSDCPRCHGDGQVTVVQGFYDAAAPCPECRKRRRARKGK